MTELLRAIVIMFDKCESSPNTIPHLMPNVKQYMKMLLHIGVHIIDKYRAWMANIISL